MDDSILDGTGSNGHRELIDRQSSEIFRHAGIAATPECIRWTQTVHQKAVVKRHNRIAVAAYLISEARGFEPGHDAEDWIAAQSQIDGVDSGMRQA